MNSPRKRYASQALSSKRQADLNKQHKGAVQVRARCSQEHVGVMADRAYGPHGRFKQGIQHFSV